MNIDIRPKPSAVSSRLDTLHQLERKLLWLSAWMIHNANHIRPNRDGLKVGGHQASCASVISIMAALYFEIARPQDRIAVKPHAGPVFHAINYLFGRQSVARWRSCGVGRRAVLSVARERRAGGRFFYRLGRAGRGNDQFSALMQDYVRLHGLAHPICRPAVISPSPAMLSWTKGISTKPCWKAGSTMFAMSGGSSTTTARAWI